MTEIHFSKYTSCSNDFVIIDGRQESVQLLPATITQLCDRRKGIGADGIIIIEPSTSGTCKMRIFNVDGSEAEMCGNGIRCVADYIRKTDQVTDSCLIESMHLQHTASWSGDQYTIDMGPPSDLRWNIPINTPHSLYNICYVDTGVPHAILFCDDVEAVDLASIAPTIRHHKTFAPRGVNVNFVSISGQELHVRTYERGVEAETPACGTGATAAAIAATKFGVQPPITVHLRSGDTLKINFNIHMDHIGEVTMTGGCKAVFQGTLSLSKQALCEV